MKYLRSYLLVPGAGGQILGGPFRRLTTGHVPAKVTSSESHNNLCIPSAGQKRRVSTDGAKKSQLAVVGQVAPALPPPNGAEIGPYVSVSRRDDAKSPRRRHDSKSYPLDDQVCPRHGNPCFSVPKESPEPVSYGQLLSESNSLKATFNKLDPVSLEMAFLPTFHAIRNDVRGLFFSDRPKSAGIPYSSQLDSPPRNSDDAIPLDSGVIELDRSKSLEALLPTDNTILVDDVSPQVSVRSVKREIVLPRTSKPNALSSNDFNAFLEVHNFQKKESSPEGEKTKEISPIPKCEDTPEHSGPFIIHNDRTSIIIHRDLYITNRILEKLKQMEDNVEISPKPTIKASTVSDHSLHGGDQRTAESCNKSLVYSDYTALADIADSADVASMSGKAVASGISKEADLEAITAQNVGQSVSSIVGSPMHPQSPISFQVSRHQNWKTGSLVTNAEFEMPRDRLTRLEYLALQSRKNLYARMKNASSPCVLVDGVNVQHRTLEEAIPGIGSCAKAEPADSNCPSLVSSGSRLPGNFVPVTGGQNIARREIDFAPPGASTASEHPTVTLETRPVSLESANHGILPSADIDSVSPTVIDFPQPSFFSNQFITESVEPYADFDSQVQGFSEANHSEMAGHDLDPFQSIGDLKSDQIQNDLEDWFIPLGKEIESMLLTLEASMIAKDCPEYLPQDFQEPCHDLGEGISNIIELGGLKPSEEVDTIESVLLSPRGHQPFEPGQSRDKSTSAGSVPPKVQNPNVDVKTETTIKCTRSGESTDINVTETQRYLDKRLPYPFCTETVLQVCGTSSSLHEATRAVENSKSQLVHLSNANSPNPGMLTPKLQFNHMLSKSHENLRPNSKKTVLKIKVVPNAASSPSIQSSEPKPTPSHVLRLSEEPRKTSTDVSKLIRRSKFNHKPGPKKARRGDTMMKLRPKKKLNKESGENIKVLSPKDLEKMFPSPPKPKPVEKPRKVTIETKAGKEYPDLVENVKQKSTQSGFVAAQFRSRKVQDDILKRPDLKSPAEVKVVIQPENEGPGVTTMKSDLVLKDQNNAALSARDQKILKSIISHKVKDSFMAVTKKAGVNPEVRNEKLEKLEPTISQLVNDFPAPEARYEKSDKVYHNDPKTVYGKILETVKEKPTKEKTPLKVPRPKSPRPESPTPKPNREYVTVKTEPPTKATRALNNATPVNAPAASEKKPERKLDENVLPVSASAIIANVMKGSTDVSQSESRWHHLDSKTASDPAPDEKLSLDNPKSADVQRRPRSAESSGLQKSQMSEAKVDVGKTSQDKSIQKKEHGNIAEKDSFREKNVWNIPSEPLFFPFETPNFKELLEEPPSKTKTMNPILIESSNPKSTASATYQMDFCKLCTENTPGLDPSAAPRYRIPLERVKTFPLVNPGKAITYSVPSSGAMSINPLHDLMLMRNLRRIPAVTKVLGATLSAKSQQALDRWKEGLISTLGEEGFQVFYQNQLKRGSDFHSTVRKFLADRLECKDDLCMQSLSKVLGSVSDVSVVESQVVHPLLGYRGVIDCVAKYKGKPVVIEWKRSDKSKPSLKHTYDAPLQLSAYLGAMNFDTNYKAQQVEGGIVAVAYSDGSPADVFELSVEECERYWAKWLKRLHQFYNSS